MENYPKDWIFNAFDVVEETYKTVESHDIKTSILIPKDAKLGVHPVIFNYHGGFLMFAHATFAPFFSPYVLKLARENSAIVVSPDYRLLPSANGVADILEDLEDFWQWTRSNLPRALARHAPGLHVDLNHVLLTGNSAGGYCAIQTALSHPGDISAMAVAYPEIDVEDRLLVTGPDKDEPTILRFPRESIPSKEESLEWIAKTKKTVRSKAGEENVAYAVGATQHGLYYSHVFDSEDTGLPEFLPIERIKSGARLPKNVWIMHGDDDTTVHIRGTHNFVNLVKEKLPETTVRLDVGVNEDHGFDLCTSTWELHALGALDYVRRSWLAPAF